MISLIIRRLVCMHIDYCLSAAGGYTRSHPMRRRNSLRQPLPPTGLAHPLTSRLSQHRWRGSATDKVLEKRTFLWIMGNKRPVEPTQSKGLTQRRQEAKTQPRSLPHATRLTRDRKSTRLNSSHLGI